MADINAGWGDVGQLRIAAESLADAINTRTRVHNRIRSGSADGPVLLEDGRLLHTGHQLTEAQIAQHPLGKAVLDFEKSCQLLLVQQYEQVVPQFVREWAATVPILKTGELFPRIVGMVGNPCWAVPLKLEGEGKNRTAVPDGEPYERGLGQLWQYCGRGDPDHEIRKGDQASLLKAGRIATVSPLLYTFSQRIVMASARSDMVQDSAFYKTYLDRRKVTSGHDGKCDKGSPPLKCMATHRRHAKTCRNKHFPPLASNGCGIVAHPEWGEVGSAWRPGHINMDAHRIVEKELLREFWALVRNH